MSGEQRHDEVQLEKSPNWDRFKDSTGFIEDGFPFNEGFPRGASPLGRSVYTVIFRDGQRLSASVDFSTQYRAEGLTWRIEQPAAFKYLDQYVIVAWCEVPSNTADSELTSGI